MPASVQLDYAREYNEGDIVEHNGAVYRFKHPWTPRTFSSFEAAFIQSGVLVNATTSNLQDFINRKLEALIVALARNSELYKIVRKYGFPAVNFGNFGNCGTAFKRLIIDRAVQEIPLVQWIDCEVINFLDIQVVEFKFTYRPAWVSGPVITSVRASYELITGARIERGTGIFGIERSRPAPQKEVVLPWEEV